MKRRASKRKTSGEHHGPGREDPASQKSVDGSDVPDRRAESGGAWLPIAPSDPFMPLPNITRRPFGCFLVGTLFFNLVAAGILYKSYTATEDRTSSGVVRPISEKDRPLVVPWVLEILALVTLFGMVRRVVSLSTDPDSTLEIDRAPVGPGDTVRLRLRVPPRPGGRLRWWRLKLSTGKYLDSHLDRELMSRGKRRYEKIVLERSSEWLGGDEETIELRLPRVDEDPDAEAPGSARTAVSPDLHRRQFGEGQWFFELIGPNYIQVFELDGWHFGAHLGSAGPDSVRTDPDADSRPRSSPRPARTWQEWRAAAGAPSGTQSQEPPAGPMALAQTPDDMDEDLSEELPDLSEAAVELLPDDVGRKATVIRFVVWAAFLGLMLYLVWPFKRGNVVGPTFAAFTFLALGAAIRHWQRSGGPEALARRLWPRGEVWLRLDGAVPLRPDLRPSLAGSTPAPSSEPRPGTPLGPPSSTTPPAPRSASPAPAHEAKPVPSHAPDDAPEAPPRPLPPLTPEWIEGSSVDGPLPVLISGAYLFAAAILLVFGLYGRREYAPGHYGPEGDPGLLLVGICTGLSGIGFGAYFWMTESMSMAPVAIMFMGVPPALLGLLIAATATETGGILGGGLVLLFGVALISWFVKAELSSRQKKETWSKTYAFGKAAPGEILRVFRVDRDSPWEVHYRFTVQGRSFDGEVSTMSSRPHYVAGQKVYVLYLEEAPETNTLQIP